jgi:ATP-dependent helicase/nuclease subunit A
MSDVNRQPSLFDLPPEGPPPPEGGSDQLRTNPVASSFSRKDAAGVRLPPEGVSHAIEVGDSKSRASDLGPPTAAGERSEPDLDAESRAYAVDPTHNVVLEASAGTGKTSVLVARYVNLLKAGIDPANILAITFTRKAAAEMRERILRELRNSAEQSEIDRTRWLDLRDRLGDIAISTIDAFCLSLLREFPLEADVDPAFELADETEVPRLISTSLDRTMRVLVAIAREDRDVALVLAQLGIGRTREGLATLLDRRLVARDALDRFLARGPRHLEALQICRDAAAALRDVLQTIPGGATALLKDGPSLHPRFSLFVRDVRRLDHLDDEPEAVIRSVLERVSGHFLTSEGKARKGSSIYPYNQGHYPTKDAAKRHREAVFAAASRVEEVMFAFNRDLNVVLARGVRRMFAVALDQYRRALEERAVLDFSDVLDKALQLLRQMDEFSQSRFRLESRYHHVLVDEFQDTSRAQWELVSLLVQAWGEGLGVAANPSIFIVGDRKQSIYRFRDADVAVLRHAADYIQGLRPEGRPRRSIARSFRSVPGLLHFVNDVFTEMSQSDSGASGFTYEDRDRFPVDADLDSSAGNHGPVLGVAVAETPDECAAAVADEIVAILDGGAAVRDRTTGIARPARPGDIGILFRSRSTHREFERELNARNVPTHVYKGLGFFDADEIKDVVALIRYLAEPTSHLRAAAFLRSRFIRLSDAALAQLAPDLAPVLAAAGAETDAGLDAEDREVLALARPAVARWLALVDRITPAELIDTILAETGYAFELGGPRRRQAWENLKKIRGLIRRIQNRGYATLPRIADYLIALSAGDESNAVVEALDSVNLMTVHAAKGLEFPIVFLVNLAKGASGPPRPVRVSVDSQDEPSVSVGPFVSDTDEAEKERERHETRRLLYVALTRARDRLYLSSTLKEGVFVPGRGSLAEVLPESLKTFFAGAANVFDEVDTVAWTGTSGREYHWRLCRRATSPSTIAASLAGSPIAHAEAADDFAAPLAAPERARVATGESVADADTADVAETGPPSDRILGLLVHRLFEHAEPEANQTEAAELCRRLLRAEERIAVDDADSLVSRAVALWLGARAREDVTMALAGTVRLFEVPFATTTGPAGAIVRGTIDCLVRKEDGSVVVVEFKTGRARSIHRRQLDLYIDAARRLHPDAPAVSGALLYL